MTKRGIAAKVGVNERTVFKWLKKHREQGIQALRAKPHPGSESPLTEEHRRQLEEILLRGAKAWGYENDLWTCPRIRDVIASEFDIHYHTESIGRVLRVMGWSVQRPQRQVVERDEKAITEWVRNTWEDIRKKPAREGRHSRL